MQIDAECPLCGHKGKVPDKFNNKEVKCPQCLNQFIVSGTPVGAGAKTGGSHAGNQKLPSNGSHAGKQKLPGSGSQAGNQKIPGNGSQAGNQKIPGNGSQAGNQKIPGNGSQAGTQKVVKPGGSAHGTQKVVKPGGSAHGTQKVVKPGGSAHGNQKVVKPASGTAHGNVKKPGNAFGDLDSPAKGKRGGKKTDPDLDISRKKGNPLGVIIALVFIVFLVVGSAIAVRFMISAAKEGKDKDADQQAKNTDTGPGTKSVPAAEAKADTGKPAP